MTLFGHRILGCLGRCSQRFQGARKLKFPDSRSKLDPTNPAQLVFRINASLNNPTQTSPALHVEPHAPPESTRLKKCQRTTVVRSGLHGQDTRQTGFDHSTWKFLHAQLELCVADSHRGRAWESLSRNLHTMSDPEIRSRTVHMCMYTGTWTNVCLARLQDCVLCFYVSIGHI